MTDQHAEEPDPANATAEDLIKQGRRGQAGEILRESEERTEDNSTVDPDDHSVIRRKPEETADPPPDEDEKEA
ncbi:MAG: hypothetical protein WD770_10285 [Actinomycetota bacterium]